ncbi:MAG TPA: autotransporter-associated beta strand repeat-containing protein [Vicinamibacterales bacterium]
MRSRWRILACAVFALALPVAAGAQTVTVSDEASLRAALSTAAAGTTILFTGNITLTADLPSVSTGLTIDGGGFALSGNNQYRGFVVAGYDATSAPTAITVNIQNITIQNTTATGGVGGTGVAGGGGGAGLGGALFIGQQATVNVSNVNLLSNTAAGGAGGAGGAGSTFTGGGGGVGGAGGAGTVNGPGGGGGFGNGATGGSGSVTPNGGNGILLGAPAGGDFGSPPPSGGANAGGGATLSTQAAGGGAAAAANYGGGGGGRQVGAGGTGGTGGFGGGGGGGDATGGGGGYAGGGGGAVGGTGGAGGQFGGNGSTAVNGGGGGGGALGGAIFNSGNLTVTGAFTINGASVLGGAGAAGATNGSAFGETLFTTGFGIVTLQPGAGQTMTVAGSISDEFGSSGTGGESAVVVSGGGTVVLTGNNNYSGGTNIQLGTLSVSADQNLGGTFSTVNISDGGVLQITGTGTFAHSIATANVIAQVLVTPGNTATWTGTISDTEVSSGLFVSGGGTLVLTNTNNSYTLGTFVNGNSEVVANNDGALGHSYFATGGPVFLGDTTTSGTLGFGASFTTPRNVVLGAAGGGLDVTGTFVSGISGPVSGFGSLTKVGSGTLVLLGDNTYSGATIVNGGTLVGSSPTAFGSSTSLIVNAGGTADLGGYDRAFNSLSGAGTVAIGTGNLMIGSDGSSSTFGGSITGSGVLTKAGGGTLGLTGINTFGGLALTSGAVLVNADAALGALGAGLTVGTVSTSGTLAIDAQFFSSSRTIVINAGGLIVDTSGGTNATLSGGISGAGGLTKSGVGVLTLTGSNSFTGVTQIQAGRLVAGGNNSLGASGLVSVASGAELDVVGGSQTINQLSGTGGLAVSNGATVVIGSDGSSSAFAGAITGAGSLTKNGGGTLNLTGANTYSGGTTVLAGALSGDSTSLTGPIVNNAAVLFNQSANGAYAGTMTGSGALLKTGNGVLTLTGNNSYSGGTLIAAGTLSGSTTSLQGGIVNNAAMAFRQDNNGTVNAVITGSGTLDKFGAGTVTINGNTPMTGLTTVDEGGLTVNGNMAGSVAVLTGANFTLNGIVGGGISVGSKGLFAMNGAVLGDMTLGANGTYNLAGTITGNLNLAGTVNVSAPGSSTSAFNAMRFGASGAGGIVTAATAKTVPTLFINGNLTTVPGSTLGVTVAQGAAAPVQVAGTATLTGTHLLVSIDDPNPSRAATYLALTAQKGVTATQNDVASPSTSLLPVLKTDGYNLMVTILNIAEPLANSVTGRNPGAVGKAVDRTKFGITGDYAAVVRELTALSGPQLENALQQLSGEIHSSTLRMTQIDGQATVDLVKYSLADFEHAMDDKAEADKAAGQPFSRGGQPWLQLAASHTSFKGDGASGGGANVGGSGAGYDFKMSPALTLGGGGSLSLGGLSLTEISGSSTMTSPHVFGYSGYGLGFIKIHGGGSLAHIKMSTERNINFAATVPDVNGNPTPLSDGINRDATSEQVADVREAWTEVQSTQKSDTWTFDSKVGYRATHLDRSPYGETGADSISLDALATIFKTRDANVDFHAFRRSGNWRPNILASYHHTYGDITNVADVKFQGVPNSQFDVIGAQVPIDTYNGLFGLTVRSFSGLEYTVEYETRQSKLESTNAFHFRVRFR